ncbi:unnamed protein product (macronuclear) [Paramecium tetraurelia]|uniref:Uncharacterized protein n=1 Tax=Paramecium tetraurelia TaxID=5888 RepID=A0EC92_PARTE|nr:uncharacterized protein GSPATT00025646001 [Paramecium tetraurelia]CAK92909.1 unnamed protein product [Paramecium tetraurelia]|eukprot:XP_001460306.1 hypothetical protein (macronuclear) [Paramecium tetraurelia strain d4-2]
MLQLINLIKLRQQQLFENQPYDPKIDKERINQENQLLQVLYRFQRVHIDEKLNFYEQSAQLMNKPIQPLLPMQVYDFIAKLYMEFFQENEFQDKAQKIQLILENEMHKNQSFIILMIKWLLEYYRLQVKKKEPQLKPVQVMRRKLLMTIDQNKLEVKKSSESQTKRIRMLNLSKSPESDQNTLSSSYQQSTLRRTKINQRQLYNVIPDLDWDMPWDRSYKILFNRNQRISRSIQKNCN